MTRDQLLSSIQADLGDNYSSSDSDVLGALLDEVIADALFVSGRAALSDRAAQLEVLGSNIRKAVKSIYLQRGAEDVRNQSLSGISSAYDNAIETMTHDIIRTQKRILQ